MICHGETLCLFTGLIPVLELLKCQGVRSVEGVAEGRQGVFGILTQVLLGTHPAIQADKGNKGKQ